MKTFSEQIRVPLAGNAGLSADRPVVYGGEQQWRSPLTTGGTLLLTSGTAYWVFVRQVEWDCIPKYVSCQVRTDGAGAQTAEVAIAYTTAFPNRVSKTLTHITSTGSLATLGAGAANTIVRNSSAFTTLVRAGTYLWAGIRTAMATTQPTLIGLLHDYSYGLAQTTAGAAALTGGGPWTGTIAAVSANAVAPDLRVEFV